ncbi:MAG: FISUMP domain-containing protein [Bacteroidales bacterium]|nr:FISUMP domain-containing protein [Bacteroidales bacterium]
MERVKRSIITIHILLATILLLLTTCKRDERDNPWDKFAAINPDAWAPKAVQTSNIDITKHEVAWTYEGDNRIEGFRIDRKEGDSEWEIGVFTAEKDDRSWIDTNVIPDTTLTYTYKVYAIAGDNKSSNIIASIDVEFPAPTSIDIEKISDVSYKLSWTDNSNGEQGFKIDRCTNGSEWQIAYGSVAANQTAYVDTNVFAVKSTIPLEYRVYGYYEGYTSSKPAINTNASLAPPTTLTITNNSITSVTLNWTDNSTGEDGFRVERKHGDGDWQLVAETKEVSIDDNDFELNTTVYYRVSAYIESYNSTFAEENFDATIPPPSNVQVEQQTNLQYKLTWGDNSNGEQGFRIDRRTGGEWQLAYGEVDANQTSYTDPNIYSSKSLEVEYRVYAYYQAYESVKVLVSTQATIDTPTNLTITANSNTSVTLNWDYTQTGHQGFKVDRKAGDNEWQDAFATIDATQTSYTDNTVSLTENEYTYGVYAYYSQYNSEKVEVFIALPTVTTDETTAISATTATSGGNVSSTGSAPITARGVVWNTTQNPTLEDNQGFTDDGADIGEYFSEITGLSANTTYYVRAYATNEVGTAYGNELSFTTIDYPTVTTTEVSSITATTASAGGDITFDGNTSITARGVCWSTSQNPTIVDSITEDGTGTGTFTSSITGLAANTTYYVRAYATNSIGTAYGEQKTFTTATVPTVITADISNILTTTATGGGNVTASGGVAVTAKGVVWSTSQNPTVTTSMGITTNGTGTGSWVSELVELTEGTTYYVRAYATNEAGTAYGEEKSFTTLTLPTLTTAEISNLASTSITTGGNITSDGGAAVTARGVCWGTVSNPTLENNFTEDGSGVGEFVSNLTGLTPTTTYYIRAYATSLAGTAYGNEVTFNTISTTQIADIDNNVYNTVTIGEQEWMAENLRTTKYKDDTTIPTGHTDSQWESLTTGAYAIYPHTEIDGLNSDAEVLEAYGALYNWFAVETGNLCPTGWHVPTDAEWTALTDYVGGASVAGTKLKATSGWNSGDNGTDEYGFSALPGGRRNFFDGNFSNVGNFGYWWSSTELDATLAWGRYMRYDTGDVYRIHYSRRDGISVRCIKD